MGLEVLACHLGLNRRSSGNNGYYRYISSTISGGDLGRFSFGDAMLLLIITVLIFLLSAGAVLFL